MTQRMKRVLMTGAALVPEDVAAKLMHQEGTSLADVTIPVRVGDYEYQAVFPIYLTTLPNDEEPDA